MAERRATHAAHGAHRARAPLRWLQKARGGACERHAASVRRVTAHRALGCSGCHVKIRELKVAQAQPTPPQRLAMTFSVPRCICARPAAASSWTPPGRRQHHRVGPSSATSRSGSVGKLLLLLSLSSAAALTPAPAVAMCTKKPDADAEPPVRACCKAPRRVQLGGAVPFVTGSACADAAPRRRPPPPSSPRPSWRRSCARRQRRTTSQPQRPPWTPALMSSPKTTCAARSHARISAQRLTRPPPHHAPDSTSSRRLRTRRRLAASTWSSC